MDNKCFFFLKENNFVFTKPRGFLHASTVEGLWTRRIFVTLYLGLCLENCLIGEHILQTHICSIPTIWNSFVYAYYCQLLLLRCCWESTGQLGAIRRTIVADIAAIQPFRFLAHYVSGFLRYGNISIFWVLFACEDLKG